MRRPLAALPAALAATALLRGGAATGAGATTRSGSAPRTPTPGTFSISPADHEVTGHPGLVLSPTTVGNTTGQPLGVRVIPVLLHQTRSGAFTYGASPAQLRAARRIVAVSTRRFSLGGQDHQVVLERWRPGARNRAAYVGVLFRTGVGAGSRGVHTVEQLLGLDLLAVPGTAPAAGRLTGVSMSDAAAHRLRATVSVRNVGRTYGTPSRVTVDIRRAGGRSVSRVVMTPGVILPGVTRDFVSELPSQLAAGRYVAVATVTLNGASHTRRVGFRVAAGGLLPATSLVPGAIEAHGSPGRPALVTIPLRNAGTRTGAPRGTVTIMHLSHGLPVGRAVARAPLSAPPIAPGRAGIARVRLGHLRQGVYEAIVHYAAPVAATQPGLVDFVARRASAGAVSRSSWLSAHLALVAMGAALLATVGFSSLRLRRLRHRVDAMRTAR